MAASTRRILALWLPRLATDRLQRGSRFDAPLVTGGKLGNTLVVAALEARAERLGLSVGMPLANARAMVQPLAVVPADPRADAALLDGIADWCDRFTPLVGLDAPNGLYLDISGAAHLFGGETALLKTVCERIAAQGFAVRGAIAGTTLSARALARHAHGSVVPAGAERDAVAPLPITALDPGARALRALRHAGLKTVGMVAGRLHSELSERLGRDFVRALRITLGAEENPIIPRRPWPDLMAERRFAEPIVHEDAIAAALLSLAESLDAILEREGRGARMLEAAFFRADGKVSRIAVRAGEPLRDPRTMLRLLRQKLDALADPLDPGFGFDLIRLEALLAEEIHPATLSFDSDENARAQVSLLLDRLSARFGEHRVQRFVPQDTHIPEAAGVAVPALERDFDGAWRMKRGTDDPPRRPLRLLEKPEPIEDSFTIAPDGTLRFFKWRQCRHEVLRAEGPERIALQWWTESERNQPSRDYFRIETREGQRFWIYRDGTYHRDNLKPRWFLHGLFA